MLTKTFASIGVICGFTGLTIAGTQAILALVLTGLSIIATLLVIAVNWDKGFSKFRFWWYEAKKKQNKIDKKK